MVKRIKNRLKLHYIKKWHLDRNQNEHIIMDINFNPSDKKQKRVLICYLDYVEVTKDLNYAVKNNCAVHTNRMELFAIIRAYIKLDFSVDVCSCSNIEVVNSIDISKYDFIFGFGDVYRIIKKNPMSNKVKKIFYFTENPYEVSLEKETERIEYFNKRHNKKEQVGRTGLFYKKDDEKSADAIISMCNPKVLKNRNNVYYIAPSANMRNDEPDFSKRDKNCFLVYGTNGFIHKGIDLLVEVFWKHPEWELYVCGGGLQDTVTHLGYGILPDNIHDIGYISVNDEIFKELTDKCTFILLPSCSEGTSTGVLTGMCRGLIPIISKCSGLDDMDDYIYYFNDYRLETIEDTIKKICCLDKEILERRSNTIYKFALNEYKLSRFENDFSNILEDIIL